MTGDIFIYGGIGTERGEISFANVDQQLRDVKNADELILHIISPGGDVFEGEAIYNAIKNTGKKITTHIEGTCASIATLIAGAGSRIIMNKTARFMIHNPMISGLGKPADSRELRHVANQLDQIKTLLINVWDKQTQSRNKPISKEELWQLYDKETWLTADEAEKKGFIDESVDAIKAVAKINLLKITSEMDKESKLQNLFKRFQNALKSITIKNEARETLEDGTPIVIMTEDGDFVQKQVMYEDGSMLPAGDHKLASGKTIVVGADSTITEVKEAEVANNQDMEKDKQIEELKAQLAEANAKLGQAEASVTTAKAENAKFQNRITNLEQDFIKLKEEAMVTVGDTTSNPKGPVFKNKDNPAKDFDPMGEDIRKHLQGRNRI